MLRSPITGTFNGVDSPGVLTPLSNLGTQRTRGFDIGAAYSLAFKDLGIDPKLGRLDFSLTATRVTKSESQPTPSSINRDCLGYYSVACGAPTFKTRFSQRTGWAVGDFVLSYNWRYLSAVKVEPISGTFLPAYSSIGAKSYVDLAAVWNVNKTLHFNVSVSNAFDKQPPIVGNNIGTTGTNSGNTFPQTYDVIGRFYTVGATLRF